MVADTNVVAYFLLESPEFFAEVREFWAKVGRALAPVHWEAEWCNLVWMSVRHRQLDAGEASQKLALAPGLGIQNCDLTPLLSGALQRSLATGVAVYDTLFVELAVQQECLLATFDQQILRTFPAIARRPRQVLDSR